MTAGGQERVAPPASLRERVLAAASHARATGQPVPAVPPIPPEEAFSRAADALYGTLCALTPANWRRPALRDLDVQGLVGHLTGVEEDIHRCLSGDPGVADADHIASTQAAAGRQQGRPPEETRAEWRQAVERTRALAGAAAGPETELAVHGMRVSLAALLVVRAFELWIHDNDIRRATGLPGAVPDGSTLRLMSDLAARMLPHGARRSGLPQPVRLRLVLTGPGGGTWDVEIGAAGEGSPSVTIVTDVVGFCRLVGNRVAPADLDVHSTGDPGLVAGLLAAASALALD